MSEARQVVARFFDEQLPAAIELSAQAFAQTQGALTIIVEGAGSWTITFGDASSPAAVVDEADIDADCIAVWTADSFASLLGAHKARAKGATRPIAMVGEIKLLARLGALLNSPRHKSGVGARLMDAHLLQPA